MAYNPIKRIRKWFFDTNIPTEPRTFLDGKGNSVTRQVKTRLAKGHFPKEETHQDLLESIFFKSAGSDLQDIATNDDIKDQLNVEKVVKPNQLPELENTTDEITYIAQDDINLNYGTTFTGDVYETNKRNHNNKNKYSWKFNKSFLGWLLTKLLPQGGNAGQILTKSSNADFSVGWTTPTPPANQLPAFNGANRILFTNVSNNAAEWRNRDYYTQTESNNLLSTEVNNRILADSNLQTELNNTQIGAGLQPNGTYFPPNVSTPIINTATSLFNADELLATTLANLSILTNQIRNGAILPQSSLQGLQDQINNISVGTLSSMVTQTNSSSFLGGTVSFTLSYRTIGKTCYYRLLSNFTGISTSGGLQSSALSGVFGLNNLLGFPIGYINFHTLTNNKKGEFYISNIGGTFVFNLLAQEVFVSESFNLVSEGTYVI